MPIFTEGDNLQPKPNLRPYGSSESLPVINPGDRTAREKETQAYWNAARAANSPTGQFVSAFLTPPAPVNFTAMFGTRPAAPITMADILGQRRATIVPPMPSFLQPPAQIPTAGGPTTPPTKEQLEMRSSMYYEGHRLAEYAAYSYAIAQRQNAWQSYLTNLAIEQAVTGTGDGGGYPSFGGGGGRGGGRNRGSFALALYNWRV